MAIENVGNEATRKAIWDADAGKRAAEIVQRSKKAREGFELHVSLLMRMHGLKKPAATWLAWCEGPIGLDNLLNPISKLNTAQPEATK